jgi:uridine kinase
MEKILQDIVKTINHTDKRIMIGISGHGGAGKTTFAESLLHILGEGNVNYINTDPYIIDSVVRRNTIIDYEYNNHKHRYKMTACHPAAHHLLSLKRDIQMMRDGIDFYTIGTNWSKSKLISSKKKVNIVEGMSVAFVDLNMFDLTLYFYTNSDTEFERRSIRDINERGLDINYLKQSHDQRRIQYEVFMHPYHKGFDIIVRTEGGEIYLEKFTQQ